MLLLQFLQKLQHLRLNCHIECGGGLVGNQQPWAIDERHGDEDALPLPPENWCG